MLSSGSLAPVPEWSVAPPPPPSPTASLCLLSGSPKTRLSREAQHKVSLQIALSLAGRLATGKSSAALKQSRGRWARAKPPRAREDEVLARLEARAARRARRRVAGCGLRDGIAPAAGDLKKRKSVLPGLRNAVYAGADGDCRRKGDGDREFVLAGAGGDMEELKKLLLQRQLRGQWGWRPGDGNDEAEPHEPWQNPPLKSTEKDGLEQSDEGSGGCEEEFDCDENDENDEAELEQGEDDEWFESHMDVDVDHESERERDTVGEPRPQIPQTMEGIYWQVQLKLRQWEKTMSKLQAALSQDGGNGARD